MDFNTQPPSRWSPTRLIISLGLARDERSATPVLLGIAGVMFLLTAAVLYYGFSGPSGNTLTAPQIEQLKYVEAHMPARTH
jgi:hypothetical protein